KKSPVRRRGRRILEKRRAGLLRLDVDRLRPLGAGRDLDRPGLGVLPLGELDLEQAVPEGGLDLVPVHLVPKPEAAPELAVGALPAVVALALRPLLEIALAPQGQHAVLGLDLDLVLLEAWKLRGDEDAILLLGDVDGRRPRRQLHLVVALRAAVATEGAVEP